MHHSLERVLVLDHGHRNVRPEHYGHLMRVGVYVDGFNLYYGARLVMGGRGIPGWRWLDLRVLSENLVRQRSGWRNATVTWVVYCTARINGASDPRSQQDQDVYLRALRAHGSVDLCEEGVYVNRVAFAPPATKGPRGKPRGCPERHAERRRGRSLVVSARQGGSGWCPDAPYGRQPAPAGGMVMRFEPWIPIGYADSTYHPVPSGAGSSFCLNVDCRQERVLVSAGAILLRGVHDGPVLLP
jgi:hypothetical protein